MSIRCSFDYDRKISYALQQNQVPIIREIEVANDGEETVENIKLTFSMDHGLMFAKPIDIPIIRKEEHVMIYPEIVLDGMFLRKLDEKIITHLLVTVYIKEEEADKHYLPMELLAANEWPGFGVLPEIISSFVTPNRPYIQKVIKQAGRLLGENTTSSALDGYQSEDPNRVLAQLSAIYTSLHGEAFTYANPPASFEQRGQRIRLVEELKDQKLGTCLDLTLMYAACAEAIGIHSILVFFDGHVLPGFWLEDRWCSESMQEDRTILTKHEDLQELVLVEATALTQPGASFKTAVQLGKDALYRPDYFTFFVDVKRSRLATITPLSFSGEREVESNTEIVHENQVTPSYEQMQLRDITDEEIENVVVDKISYWKSKLLDFSRRNRLLSYNLERHGIPIVSHDLGEVEDILVSGDKLSIEAAPSEWNSSIRQFKEHTFTVQQTIVAEDMKAKRLRSPLYSKELDKRLITTYRAAKSIQEESGSNALFLALGFLSWKDDKSRTGDERFAPLLLVPVNLIRVSAKKGYQIESRSEETDINVSLLEFLRHEYDIDVSSLQSLPKDDRGIDVPAVMTRVRRLVKHMPGWDVLEAASIGTFSFAKFVMWKDLSEREDDLRNNKIVQSLIENRAIFEATEKMSQELTEEQDIEQLALAPLSADSTQMEAILAAADNNSFVVHGPPGSGKSQTIANMIAHALGNNKTVLFVAEKMAALQVVHQRLEKLGLGDFSLEVYSNKAQRRDVLEQLERSFSLKPLNGEWAFDQTVKEIAEAKKQLHQATNELHEKTMFGPSLFQMIETFTQMSKSSVEAAVDRVYVENITEKGVEESEIALDDLVEQGKICGDIANHPLKNWGITNHSLQLQDQITESLSDLMRGIGDFREQFSKVDRTLPMPYKKHTIAGKSKYFALVEKMEQQSDAHLSLVDKEKKPVAKSKVAHVVLAGQERDKISDQLLNDFDRAFLNLDAEKKQREWREAESSSFVQRWLKKRKLLKELSSYSHSGRVVKQTEYSTLMEQVITFNQLEEKLSEASPWFNEYFYSLWNQEKKNWNLIETASDWAWDVEGLVKEWVEAEDIHSDETKKSVINQLQDCRESLANSHFQEKRAKANQTLNQLKADLQALQTLLAVESSFLPDEEEKGLMKVEKELAAYQSSIHLLKDWTVFNRLKEIVENHHLTSLLEKYTSGQVAHDEVVPSYRYQVYRLRIDQEIQVRKTLKDFSAPHFEAQIERFKQLDEELAEKTKLEIYSRLVDRMPDLRANVEGSEPGQLMRAIKSNGRGLSLRNLFQRIPNLLPRIKPCMLMSPLSVAQYIDPSMPLFDLVIFDEASQMPTSEAIGAMARGKSVIVVGDPKQLPPTSFFKSQKSEAEEDFDLEDMESVLDDCLAIQMPEKHLRWHYRSEHESLISFSNNHYYGNKLITFPSVDVQKSKVSFRNVEGTYDRGKTKQNRKEAEAIVEEIFQRLGKKQDSIGVITFSQVQQALIEDLIELRLAKQPELEPFFSEGQDEVVFVKNLENVQGDERDVILFSVGYGPDEDKKLSMNFGPLNRDGGWRRLNVAVSRAKKEMVLFTSMEPDQIQLSRTKAQGVHDLRAFMQFAKNGLDPRLLENEGEDRQNSEAIASILYERIQKHGYQCAKNIGASDFTIDLAIEHHEKPGSYQLAILIDGSKHAADKSARDRYKSKATMLERFGWKVINVWGVEWWHDEERVWNKISTAIEELKHSSPTLEQSVAKQIASVSNINDYLKEQTELEANENYEECELPAVGLTNDEFYLTHNRAIIMNQIDQIVNAESPIHFSALIRRISTAWGFARSGARISQVIEEIVQGSSYLISNEVEKGRFIWKDVEQKQAYNQFRKAGSIRRSPNEIALEEYKVGVDQIMQAALTLTEDGLIREINKQLGFSRINSEIELNVKRALDLMIIEELLEKEGELIKGHM